MRKRSTSLAATLILSALLHGVATADTASCPLSTSVFPVSFLALERYEVRITDGGVGDLDGVVDGACSLAVTACLGTAACTPAPVERVRVGVRGRTIGTTPRDVAREITDAFAALPWAARDGNAVMFLGSEAPQTCGQSRVRIPASSRSDQSLSIRVSTRDPSASASGRLRLRCVPVDESGQPAPPICVALERAWCPIEPGAPTVTTSTTTTTTTALGDEPAITTTSTTPPPSPSGHTYYISPAGSDDGAGTSRFTAFRRFSKAIRVLQPGDVLVVLSGTYTRDTTGLPRVDCDTNAENGTEAAPITIRAESEREAFLSSDGYQAGFEMSNCRWWVVEGLRAASRDNTEAEQGGGYPFRFSFVENVTLRRLLGSHNNRPQNTHVYAVENSSHVLLEECEAYFYHRHGFSIWKSYGVILRRCYANSMRYGERGCCSDIDNRDFGDEAVSIYGSSQTIVENSVSENFGNGFQIHGVENPLDPSGSGGRHNQVLGSISIDDEVGGLVSSRETGGEYHNALGNVFRDFLAVTPVGNGLHLRGAWDTVVENVTLYGSTDAAGLLVDGGDTAIGGSCGADNRLGCGFTARNLLAVQNFGAGVAAEDQQNWDVEHSNAVGSDADWYVGEAFADTSGHVQRSSSRDPGPVGLGQGECIAWIPDGSPMKGAGENGADIGANIVYRYENGVLTHTPLWDPTTGAFPCGAVVPGINDGARACRSLHERLNVNTNGCRLPLP